MNPHKPGAAVVGTGLTHGSDAGELATALPHVSLRRIPRYARMALLAAVRAMDDAGWRQDAEGRGIALVIGTAYSGVQMSLDFMDSILDDGPRLSSPIAFSHAVNNMGAGLLSLLLDLRGPCLTVSQFELSFAGVVAVATGLLHAGRARRVLAGAVDETDARFARCCPQVRTTDLLQAEGAVFLCLEAPAPARPTLRVRWEQGAPKAELPSLGHEPRARGPLAQALETLLALRAVRLGKRLDCPCTTAGGKRAAIIEVWGAQP